MYEELLNRLEPFAIHATSKSEHWGFLSMEGLYFENINEELINLYSSFESFNLTGLITLNIDTENIKINEILDCINERSNWSIHINKSQFPEKLIDDHYHEQIFYSQEDFLSWSRDLDPFNPDNPLNKNTPLKIIVRNLDHAFGGPKLLVCRQVSEDTFDSFDFKLPTEKSITEIVHIISQESIIINPLNHLISFGSIENRLAEYFLKKSAIVLSACLVSEFYNRDKIILRGIKRIQLQLGGLEPNLKIDLNYLTDLREVVSWIYEDKIETRSKLFIDRITLDLDFDKSYTSGLIQIIDSSFQQAKERYNFVIIERKDQYLKELRELLKDVKSQSDLYSNKLRSLLSNLLRDVLAGLLLVGFSFFTKVSEITKLNEERLIEYVFKGFAIYFVISALFQSVVDLFDIKVSNKEMRYWKNITREYIPQKEFENHLKESLHSRKRSIKILYPIILLIYLLIAILSWNFPSIWKLYLNP